MLRLFDRSSAIDRRQLLSIGTLGLGGLSLSSLLASRAAAGETSNPLTGKFGIFLFQQGGPSQFETFDPKTEAPSGICTLTDIVQTSVPGVMFGSTMSRLAQLANKFNLTPRHLISTIMHMMFDVGQLRITPGAPRQVFELSDHDPIPGLT